MEIKEQPKIDVTTSKKLGFPGGSDSKVSACSAGNLGWIPRSGRSPGEGNGNPPQYFCLENSIAGGAWQATVYGIARSQTQLSNSLQLRVGQRYTHAGSGDQNRRRVAKYSQD